MIGLPPSVPVLNSLAEPSSLACPTYTQETPKTFSISSAKISASV